MSKKHFLAIANVMRNNQPEFPGADLDMWESIVDELAEAFIEFAPAFDRDRFTAACGYSDCYAEQE